MLIGEISKTLVTYIKVLGKQESAKPLISRCKKIIRMKLMKRESKNKTYNLTKKMFFEKMNRIDKFLTKVERERD